MKQFLKTVRENPGFFITVLVMVLVLVWQGFFSGQPTALSQAPLLNWVIALVIFAGAFLFGRAAARDKFTWSQRHNLNMLLQLGVIAALVVLGFLVLLVWHGGPIKPWL